MDLDGTLIDARPRQVELARHHLAALGETLDGDAFWAKKREGLTTRAALDELGYAGAAEVAARWAHDIEARSWLTRDPWLEGVREVLAQLSDCGVRTVVVTARRDEAALLEQVKALGLVELVDAVVVVDPKQAAVEKASHLRGVELFVGDTESDAEAARMAGVPFVAVASGVRSRDFLEARGLRVEAGLREAWDSWAPRFFTAEQGGARLRPRAAP